MIRADSLRGWVRVVLLYLSLATQAAAAESLIVTFASPAAGATVSSDVSIMVRIVEDGRPFTEAGARRWAQATVLNQRGQTVAQLPLRDHGQGSDRRRGDGEWTATAHLRLPDGQYRLAVAVQRGEERFLHETSFAVSATHAPPPAAAPEARVGAGADLAGVEARIGELAAQVRALAARPPSEARSVLFVAVGSLLVLSAIFALVLAIRLWTRRPAPAAAEEETGDGPSQQAPSQGQGEKWHPLFGALESIQTAARGIAKDLSSTFQAHQRLADQWVRLASELVSVSQSLASVDALAAPEARALKAHLRTLLSEGGVEPWEPPVGGPAPPECEQRPDPESHSAPPHTIMAVLAPGFRMRHGDGWIVLVRPVVAVATGTRREEKA